MIIETVARHLLGQRIDRLCSTVDARGGEVARKARHRFTEAWCLFDVLRYDPSRYVRFTSRPLHSLTIPHDSVDVKDLPFHQNKTPDVFTPFRSQVERNKPNLGRSPLQMPAVFKPFPSPPTAEAAKAITTAYGVEVQNKTCEELLEYLMAPIRSEYPEAAGLIGDAFKRDERSAVPFKGGETSALARLDEYFHQGSPPPVAKYKVSP